MMMMMKLAVVLALVAAPAVVPMVQAQEEEVAQKARRLADPCEGKNEKKCAKKDECTFIIAGQLGNRVCILTLGEDSVARQGQDNVAPSYVGVVSGGLDNIAGAGGDYNVVSGGRSNYPDGMMGTVSGGGRNKIETDGTDGGTISGGNRNTIVEDSKLAAISGGSDNSLAGDFGTISGGKKQVITGKGGVITGGDGNMAGAGTVTGGKDNMAMGFASVVSGGMDNTAEGDYSVAFGTKAQAVNKNSMVINLGTDKVTSDSDGQFLAVATSYTMQIQDGKPDKNGNIQTFTINEDNVQYLIDLLEEEE